MNCESVEIKWETIETFQYLSVTVNHTITTLGKWHQDLAQSSFI